MKICRNCGAELEDDAIFCGDCGTKFENLEMKNKQNLQTYKSGFELIAQTAF